MNNSITFEYILNKNFIEKAYFRKIWLRQTLLNFIFGIGVIPVWIMLAMSFGVITDQALGLEGKSIYFFTVFMTIYILSFFFIPVYKLYYFYKKQTKALFSKSEEINNKFHFSEITFCNENDIFSIEASWSHTTLVLADKDSLIFQLKSPSVFFTLPTNQVTNEIMMLIKNNIPKK